MATEKRKKSQVIVIVILGIIIVLLILGILYERAKSQALKIEREYYKGMTLDMCDIIHVISTGYTIKGLNESLMFPCDKWILNWEEK